MDFINERINALRKQMKLNNLNAFIIPSTDPHSGEYVPSHWQSREWISGFTGSAGTAVITLTKAALWTDSRYFIQASEQLKENEFILMKERIEGTPTIAEWLSAELTEGNTVGIDGTCTTISYAQALSSELMKNGICLDTEHDLIDTIWNDRPLIPSNKPFVLPIEYAGCECSDKLQAIRNTIESQGAESVIISALDEIAWTLNMRGNDIHCNPVFVSYLLVTATDATLFIDSNKLSDEIIGYLSAQGVKTCDYNKFFTNIGSLIKGKVLITKDSTNFATFNCVGPNHISGPSPVAMLKAIKNPTEIKGYRNAMIRDGVALVKFLKWLLPAVAAGGETEISIDRKLTSLRAEQELFRGISFDTIAGYGAHAAIVHYEATPETDAPLHSKGLLLIDSGAQYLDGTTDITRTIALGPVSPEEKHDYTLVLKGNIQLAQAVFPEGTAGTQLDVLARSFMWKEKQNYLHGTGHGVGSFLNVHEGPHQIRMNWVGTPLLPGMTVTDEPGLYKEGKHGIRIENMLLVKSAGEGMFGRYCNFEILTLCPIDTAPIDWSLMTNDEIEWLNSYHAIVYNSLAPHLSNDEKEWLREATKQIEK